MSIAERLNQIKTSLPSNVTLVAVSKTHPAEAVKLAYDAGQRVFGENKVQEMVEKYEQLPSDIQWHLIGHLQTNKVKYIAPFVSLIHSVDSLKLLQEINKRAAQNNRVIDCLLQVYIAREESKFGLDEVELAQILNEETLSSLPNIRVKGLMGMATFTENREVIKGEFAYLKKLFDGYQIKTTDFENTDFEVVSMGMSGDYPLAIEQGSTMIRVGSSIFGARDYSA